MVVTTGAVEIVEGAVVEVFTAVATGQNINTQRRTRQETPPRDRERTLTPLVMYVKAHVDEHSKHHH